MRLKALGTILACMAFAGLAGGDSTAMAARESLGHEGDLGAWLVTSEGESIPPPNGQIEGACGLAVSSDSSGLYVADYYHRVIDLFTAFGTYGGQIGIPGPPPVFNHVSRDGVCGLAAGPSGELYANEFHQGVLRVLPGPVEAIDGDGSTGVAVDAAGNVFVDDRTYVAEYQAPVAPGEPPARTIGLGSLEEGYGVAVDPGGDRVYVPDAGDDTIKIYEPAVSLTDPVDTIEGPGALHFGPLDDAAVTVDASAGAGQGHLLVVVNRQPLFERPRAAIYEFDADGEYLDTLQDRSYEVAGETIDGPIFGEPSGIAVDPSSGWLYVTTGNSERSNAFAYGPYESAPLAPTEAGGDPGAAGARIGDGARPAERSAGAAASVVEQRRGVRVSFDGKLTPHVLPRHGTAPVGILVDAQISATGGEDPPQLRRITIAINRNGRFTSKGLPACRVDQIQPSTTANALAACRRSLVGEGRFSANVKLPQQSPFPSAGKVLAFNGKIDGKPAILAHIYGTEPVPTSTVLSFLLRGGRGTYGTTLEASLPQATGNWGYVTGLRMSLRRRFSAHGRSRSYLSAGCPAPAGFPSASFPLAKTSFAFAGDLTLDAVLTRTCRAQG